MSNYVGVSIVDYLKSVGKPSDYSSRAVLAQQKGIQNYTGTAEQNTQLLNMLNIPVSTSIPTFIQTVNPITGKSTAQVLAESTAAAQKAAAMIGTTYTPPPQVQTTYTPPPQVQALVEPKTTSQVQAGQVSTPILLTPTALTIQDQYTQSMMANLEAQRKANEDAYQKQIDAAKKEAEAAQTKIDELTTKEKAMIETDVQPLLTPFRETLVKTERERLNVEENYLANQTLTNELSTLLTDIQTSLQSEKDITGLAAIREPRIAKAKEDSMARVGVIEAVMAARNNQITVANNFIDKTSTAITADRQDKLNYYNTLLNFYDKQRTEEGVKLLTLTTEQKTWVNKQIVLLENDLSQAESNVNYIKGLMRDPATAVLAGEADINLNMTPQQVNTALATAAYQKDKREYIKAMALDEKVNISEAEAKLKPKNEIFIIPDARGNNMYFWKKTEVIKTGPTEKTGADVATILYNVGIPTAVATTKGKLNKSYYDKAVSAGLTPQIINGLWQSIIEKNTFEDIRQTIRGVNGDPAALDTFVQILQGKGGGSKIENPFK